MFLFESFHRVDLLIISLTDKPTCLLRNYVIASFPAFHLVALFGAAVPLLPASSLRTETWFTGECIPVCVSDGLSTFAVSPAPQINPVPKCNAFFFLVKCSAL